MPRAFVAEAKACHVSNDFPDRETDPSTARFWNPGKVTTSVGQGLVRRPAVRYPPDLPKERKGKGTVPLPGRLLIR